MGMGEEQCAGNSDQYGKDQPGSAETTRPFAPPFKCRQSDYQHRKETMQKDFWIRKSRPEADRPERPGLRVATEK